MSVFGYQPTYQPTYAPQTGPGMPMGSSPNIPGYGKASGPSGYMPAPSNFSTPSFTPGNVDPFYVNFNPEATGGAESTVKRWEDPNRKGLTQNLTTYSNPLDSLGNKDMWHGGGYNPLGTTAPDLRTGSGGGKTTYYTGGNNNSPLASSNPHDLYKRVQGLSYDQLRNINWGSVNEAFQDSSQNLSNYYSDPKYSKGMEKYGQSLNSDLDYLQKAYESLINQANSYYLL